MKRLVASAFSISLSCAGLRAEVELRIAVASNFHYTLTELAEELGQPTLIALAYTIEKNKKA